MSPADGQQPPPPDGAPRTSSPPRLAATKSCTTRTSTHDTPTEPSGFVRPVHDQNQHPRHPDRTAWSGDEQHDQNQHPRHPDRNCVSTTHDQKSAQPAIQGQLDSDLSRTPAPKAGTRTVGQRTTPGSCHRAPSGSDLTADYRRQSWTSHARPRPPTMPTSTVSWYRTAARRRVGSVRCV